MTGSLIQLFWAAKKEDFFMFPLLIGHTKGMKGLMENIPQCSAIRMSKVDNLPSGPASPNLGVASICLKISISLVREDDMGAGVIETRAHLTM